MNNATVETLNMVKMAIHEELSVAMLDVHVESSRKPMASEIVIEAYGRMIGESAPPEYVKYPASWLQHFKQDCLPAFMLRYFPVKKTTARIDMTALYPDLTRKIAGENPKIRYDTFTYTGDEA